MKIFCLLTLTVFFSITQLHAQVENTSYTTAFGEKVLQLSIIVPAEKTQVWKLFTTEEGLKKWIAPVVKLNMKTGGFIRTNYDKTKTADDSSSIQLGIINYIENELMTLKVNLNDNFAPDVKADDKNLQEILQFVEMGNGKTKIISTMVGWGNTDNWNKTYAFFEKGNDWTYKEILKLF
ncbi:MAG: SRPBCC domain-containing protein [Ilyomonas sp.]